jgi:hypothetical protein
MTSKKRSGEGRMDGSKTFTGEPPVFLLQGLIDMVSTQVMGAPWLPFGVALKIGGSIPQSKTACQDLESGSQAG